MSRLKKLIAIGTTATMLLWSFGMVLPAAHAATIADGDLVKSADSSAVYYIQGANKRVFPHYNVYLSWGYPADFSTVKTVSASELAAYTDDNSMPFRDGSLFRGTATGLGGLDTTAVFYVENSELRPVLSEQVYQGLFHDTDWVKVTWVPDDLLTKFNYDMGADLITSATHPNGTVVKYTGTTQKYLIEGGQKRAISDAAFSANRYLADSVITIDTDEVYAAGSTITGVESGLLTPGWVATTGATSALTASLYNSPASATVPNEATNVPLLKTRLTAGSSAVTVTSLMVKRTDLGASADWSTLYLYEDNARITPAGRSLTSDTHEAEFAALSISIPANTSKVIELRGDLKTVGATDNSRHAFQLTAVESSATVSGLPLTGNVMVVGAVDVATATINVGSDPVDPSVGAKAAEIANFTIQATGNNDISFGQVVFTFTGTISRNDITNIKLYLMGETTSLASVSSIASNDTFTMTLASPYVITKGLKKTFLLKADLAGRVTDNLTIYVDETHHLVVSDNQYPGFGVAVTNDFDSDVANQVALQGGKITLADNGPVAGNIGKNQQDVAITNFAVTSDRSVEVRKLTVTLTCSGNWTGATDDPIDDGDLSDLRIKDADTGATLASEVITACASTGTDYEMTDSFYLTAGVTRNLSITVDLGADTETTPDLTGTIKADLDMVTHTGTNVEIRDTATGDYIEDADVVPNELSGDNQTFQAADIILSVASTPVSETYVKGAQGVGSLGIVFRAEEASSMSVRQIKIRVYATTKVATPTAISPVTVISTIDLYDGSTLLKTKNISYSSGDYGTATFDGLTVAVPAGSTKMLTFEANLLNTLGQASYYWIEIKDGDVVSYDADGNSKNPDDDINADGGSVKITVESAGTITAATAADTPSESYLIAGSTNNIVSKIKFTASKENYTVSKLTVKLNNTGSARSIAPNGVKIAYPGGSAIGSLSLIGSAQKIVFTGLNWTIEKDTEEVLTISTDINLTTAGTATGDAIKFELSTTDNDFRAVAPSGTQDINIEAGAGDTFYTRKSVPTVGLEDISGVLGNGTKTLSKFKVTADNAGPIALKKLSFDVVVSEYAGATTLVADAWKIYELGKSTPISVAFACDTATGNTTSTFATTGSNVALKEGTHVLLVEFETEEEIAAGADKVFVLKANIGYGSIHDSITTNLLNDDHDTEIITSAYLVDDDASLVKLNDGSAKVADFIWSDKYKGVDHDYEYGGDTAKDWTDGFLIKILPTDTQTLTWPS